MAHIENVIIGFPVVPPSEVFAFDKDDWDNDEFQKTRWTEERNIAKVMKDLGFVSSTSEVRRNKPELCRTIPSDTLDFIEIKWGKKKLFILVGRETDNKQN